MTDTSPLKILIIGYYGHMNAGDDILQQSICHIFSGHKLIFSNWSPSTLVMQECDLVVVGGGSIWPGFSLFQNAEMIAKELDIPIFVLGISVKEPNARVRSSTIPLIEKAAIFHVRDRESAEYFGRPSNLTSGVDLMWWLPAMNGDDRPRTHGKSIGLNLRSWEHCRWSPDSIVEAIKFANIPINPVPMCFGLERFQGKAIPNDYELLTKLGLQNVPPLWTDLPIQNSSLVVSMRYHGLLIATRMGIPCIGFNYHPKIISLFSEMGLPELCLPLDKPGQLVDKIEDIFSNYDSYADRFASVSKRYREIGSVELHHCRAVLGKLQPRREPDFVKRLIRYALAHL